MAIYCCRGATVRERIPTYGKCEGLLVVEIEKNGKTLSLIVAYSEFPRKGFSVDRKAFEVGVCREFARARRRGNDSHPFVLWDANIRVACDVEPGNPLRRDGEPTRGNNHTKEDVTDFLEAIAKAGGSSVHGRCCPWNYTFNPVVPDPEDESRCRGRSVVDYVICGRGDEGNIFDAGILGRHKANIGSDHNALFIRADVPLGQRTLAGHACAMGCGASRRVQAAILLYVSTALVVRGYAIHICR